MQLYQTPYGAFLYTITRIWSILPFGHPAISSVWTVDNFVPSPGIFVLVFMVKFPLLILDVMTGILLYRHILEEGLSQQKAFYALLLWLLNPYVLLNEMWGALDLLSTFLTVLAFVSIRKDKYSRGAIALAAAIATRLFPLMLLPTFPAFFRNRRSALLLSISALFGLVCFSSWTSVFSNDPFFLLTHSNFITSEYELSSGMGNTGIASLAVFVAIILIASYWPRDNRSILDSTLVVLLLFFAFFANWLPQFLVLIVPFLILDLVLSNRNCYYLVLLELSGLMMNVIAYWGYFTANGHAFFFVPLYSQLIAQAMSAYISFARSDLAALVIGQLSQALFSAVSIVYALEIVATKIPVAQKLKLFWRS